VVEPDMPPADGGDGVGVGVERQRFASPLGAPAAEARDPARGVAVGVREQHRVDRVDAARLVVEVPRDVDEDRDPVAHQRRALAPARPSGTRRSAAGSGSQEAQPHVWLSL